MSEMDFLKLWRNSTDEARRLAAWILELDLRIDEPLVKRFATIPGRVFPERSNP